MQRYRLKQGKLRPHLEGEWVLYEDVVAKAGKARAIALGIMQRIEQRREDTAKAEAARGEG